MTTFNAMIDDLGRIELPLSIMRTLNSNYGDNLTIEVDLDETGEPTITLTSGTMKTEKPEEEKIIVNFVEYDDRNKVIKISKEQFKLLDWLCENDYITEDVDIDYGYPSVSDLTE